MGCCLMVKVSMCLNITEQVKSTSFCSEGTFRLLDRFGVHSHFYSVYALLTAFVLVGLVTAVIWFKLRSRGEQTCGCQSREEQHNGDANLYDNTEMVN